MKFITKKHLSRRTVLKGIGASIGLPLLDAMIPAGTVWAQTVAATPPKRFAFIYFPLGAVMDRWSPKETGTNYTMSEILKPLEPFRKHMTIVSGLRNKPGETSEPHAYIEMGWLTCVPHLEFGQAGPDSGVSCDQIAARHVGQGTRVPSLELGIDANSNVSWRTPKQKLPYQSNPRAAFRKLFGEGDNAKERAEILAETGSILDRVKDQAQRLKSDLGVRDQTIVADYLDSVREIERRVQIANKQSASGLVIPKAPVGTPEELEAYIDLMFDLIAIGFQADVSRVITLALAKEASLRTYPNLGISEAWHPLSHHGNIPEKLDRLVQIQKYHTELFAKFIKKIESMKEGDGTVLDHSTILYGSNMSNSDKHNLDPLPSAILGHANGKIKGGQHLKYPQDSRHADLLLTLLQRNDIPVKSIGDSTKGLAEV